MSDLTVFNIVVLVSAFCGLAMVMGGIFLLAKGAITLAATPKSDALTVEWRKQFKINTQVPGLAFFVIGLLFIGASLSFSKPAGVAPIELHGEIQDVDAPVTVIVGSPRWPLLTSTSGQISGKIYPDITMLVVEASAPGYLPVTTPVVIRQKGEYIANIGRVRLQKQIGRIAPDAQNIAALPFQAPPVVTNRFGAPQ